MKIDIGINEADRKAIADGLSKMLADTYTLYVKSHNFHWNVTGPNFHSLHEMFEEQYRELAEAVDVIAERIRALGFLAPGGFSKYQDLSAVKESPEDLGAEEMIKQLVHDHETVARTIRHAFASAEKANDQPTIDLMTQRMQIHEKTAWMLRSLVE